MASDAPITHTHYLDDNRFLPLVLTARRDGEKLHIAADLDLSQLSEPLTKSNLAQLIGLSVDNAQQLEWTRQGDHVRAGITIDKPASAPELRITINDRTNGLYSLNGDAFTGRPENRDFPLTVSEIRMLGFPLTPYQLEKLPYPRGYAGHLEEKHLPVTDLHTHLSAQLSGRELLDIAIDRESEQPTPAYPCELLNLLNIDFSDLPLHEIRPYRFDPAVNSGTALECEKSNDPQKVDNPAALKGVLLSELRDKKPAEFRKLAQNLSIPFDTTHGPDDFDKYMFRFRNPLEKNPALAEDKIMAVAKHYRDQGIQYAELSTGAMLSAQWLREAIPAIEKAEAEYGVKLRLLVGIPRTDPPDIAAKKIEKIKFLAQCPYIVGVDFLGFEGNKTSDFSWAIFNLARWSRRMRNNVKEVDEYAHFNDNFLVRVHAGENNENPANVDEVVEIAHRFRIPMRVGHAIHDTLTPEQRKLAKDAGIIIEFPIDSNIALRNAQYPDDVRIKQWLDEGFRCVVGSDGTGAYQTCRRQLAKTLLAAGLELNDLERMQARELDYIQEKSQLFSDKKDAFDEKYDGDFKSFAEEYREHTRKIDAIDAMGLPERYHGKKPILIAGASGSSWERISPEHQEQIRIASRMMVEMLDPRKIYFATGRVKDRGIEKELDHAIAEHDHKHWRSEPPFDMIATIAPDEGKVSIATGVSWVNRVVGKAANLAEPVMAFIKQHNGIAILGGGKVLTGEFINQAITQQVNYALLQGPQGTADNEARRTDSKHIIAASAEVSLAENMLFYVYGQLGADVFKPELREQLRDVDSTRAAIRETYHKTAAPDTKLQTATHDGATISGGSRCWANGPPP